MNERKCLQCYEQLRGRADQKFCNDQCRSAYNNSQYVESNMVIKSVNKILKKNYSILTMLTANGRTTAIKNELHNKGYCFDFFTCTSTTRNGHINYFCYDHGIRELANNKLMLIHTNQTDEMISPRT